MEIWGQLQLKWAHSETVIYVYILQALETRQADDTIEILRNWISLLFQAFADLPYRLGMLRK